MINNALIPQHGGQLGTTVPIVTTGSITSITYTDATAAGNITSDGGAAVTIRGICWSESTSTPTYPSSAYATSGSGTGAFTASLTSLTAGTTYYYRAFAINSAGTGYGSVLSFSTTAYGPPKISEAGQWFPTPCDNNWPFYYTVSSDGGATVTSNGLILSTNQWATSPVVYTNSGTGMFITGAIYNTGIAPAYVIAYATNVYGTTYFLPGQKIQPFQAPALDPITINNIYNTDVIVSSYITLIWTYQFCTPMEGGAVLGTTPGPTVTSYFKKKVYSTNINNSTSMAGMLISGLARGTKYYVRAYGGSSQIGYGAETSFTTL